MSAKRTTKPFVIETTDDPRVGPGMKRDDTAWVYGADQGLRVARRSDVLNGNGKGPTPNHDGSKTNAPQSVRVPSIKPLVFPQPRAGRRHLRPMYQWEGVVEQVMEDGFEARLVPLGGDAGPDTLEFTTFSLDDLADESDRDLVTEGAVFYWTIGKGRNPAGTQSNVSLVRFRRLPPSGRYHRERAAEEARDLLRDLGEEPSS